MTTHVLNGPPFAIGQEFFPESGGFPAAWEQIRSAAAWRHADPRRFLEEWCGSAPPAGLYPELLADVNHVACYLGDYRNDQQVFDWHVFLEDRRSCGELASVDMGPSYIAPRQYGTPGWWYSVSFPDGFVIEMFCCRSFGDWPRRSAAERAALMSHLAINVRTEHGVRAALDLLAGSAAQMETISYTEADTMGHTYGHVRNNATQQVVEFVHEAAQREGGRNGHHRD